MTIRSVHTDTQIFFLASWEDSTESVSHKTWVWNADNETYDQGDDREDMFALAFEHTGPFDADMLAGIEAVWDVWHWKAFRTNPAGIRHGQDPPLHADQAATKGEVPHGTKRKGGLDCPPRGFRGLRGGEASCSDYFRR